MLMVEAFAPRGLADLPRYRPMLAARRISHPAARRRRPPISRGGAKSTCRSARATISGEAGIDDVDPHIVAAVWKTVAFGRRSDCALCGYPVVGGEAVLRVTHRYGRSTDLCADCAVAIGGAAARGGCVAGTDEAELHEVASRLAMRVAYTIDDVERLLKAVHGDPAIARSICEAAAAAHCADPLRFFTQHWPLHDTADEPQAAAPDKTGLA